jgi:hypothetical protein
MLNTSLKGTAMHYTWTYMGPSDSNDLMALSLQVEFEVNTIFKFNPNVLAHNIVLGLVNQFYTGHSDLIVGVRDDSGKLMAYTWAKNGDSTMWSTEKVMNIAMAHVDPNLSSRTRIKLLQDMLEIWERFAQISNTPIITSSTLRHEQNAFLKLHERAGYTVRGSAAYLRVDLSKKPTKLFDDPTQATPAD